MSHCAYRVFGLETTPFGTQIGPGCRELSQAVGKIPDNDTVSKIPSVLQSAAVGAARSCISTLFPWPCCGALMLRCTSSTRYLKHAAVQTSQLLSRKTAAATVLWRALCPPPAGAFLRGMATAVPTPPVTTVNIHGSAVPVTAQLGITAAHVEKVIACAPFLDWIRDMDPELVVANIEIQSVDMFGDRVGFVKFRCNAQYHGKTVPGIVFMRGGAVAILVVLRSGSDEWALCCRQPRLCVGKSAFLEIPAGMLDGSGQFAGVAAKEMKEETGIEITDDQLVDMTELAYGAGTPAGSEGLRGMYPSVGACDEFLRLLYFSKDMTAAELEELRGKATGCIEENEAITLDLIKVGGARLLLYLKSRVCVRQPCCYLYATRTSTGVVVSHTKLLNPPLTCKPTRSLVCRCVCSWTTCGSWLRTPRPSQPCSSWKN